MKTYRDIDGDSGVVAYEIGLEFIRVQFSDGSIYEYTYASASQERIEEMKKLAEAGEGLNAFINQHVRKKYARKHK
jgi:hypothetical protein